MFREFLEIVENYLEEQKYLFGSDYAITGLKFRSDYSSEKGYANYTVEYEYLEKYNGKVRKIKHGFKAKQPITKYVFENIEFYKNPQII